MADLHFAPTKGTSQNLILEGIEAKNIIVTGNTVIDALEWVLTRIRSDENRIYRLKSMLKKKLTVRLGKR